MPFGAGAAGASRPKSLYPRHLQPKVYAPRTDAVFDTASKGGYNVGMTTKDLIGDKIIDMGHAFGRIIEPLPDHEIPTQLHDSIQAVVDRWVEEHFPAASDLHDVRFTVSVETLWN